ncbi:MAG: TlyA family RNA methyltransferase [Syntrophomonadaceae bacterium]|nr:TlyA family RNA methyltransferase [Syntrophomonadaceae bacterium]
MKKEKKRLDIILVEQGLFESREKARAAIMAGRVLVNGQPANKAGAQFPTDALIRLRGEDPPFVSRGGLKLAKALAVFPVSLKDKVVLDIGASTGGFTDCALQNGAACVVAIDVGYGQLAWSLRQDPRVVCLERTNIRYLTPDQLAVKGDIGTIDVSFISLNKVLPSVKRLLKTEGQVIALIKPQFEAGPDKVGKKGVVKDPVVHQEVILSVISAAQGQGFTVKGLSFSPLLGPEGNIEYLIWLEVKPTDSEEENSLAFEEEVKEVVRQAHSSLIK